jgi:8-oxo-dGTP pyrophosphatase MutT (NUDIX family)/pimeloyl-ACP methyl ester carboxylesterase
MSDVHIGAKRYRRNVGVVLFNREGKVWLGRRADTRGERIWQFPQGGVDKGEDLIEAARRELFEETGVRTVALIGRAPGWITYDFPPGFTGAKAMKGFAGQTQAWFAFRFEGEDGEIDLAAHHQIEFDAWRWADIETAPDLVAVFKHDAYRKVVAAFSPIVRGEPMAQDAARGDILMIHGVGCTGRVWDRMAADFRSQGWRVAAPTLKAKLRVKTDPPKALTEATLTDYVNEAEGWARRIERETARLPVLLGHSMGGLIVQKLMERGVARAGVLITPASPADVGARLTFGIAFTAANILLVPRFETKALKVWRTGFEWGMLNCVPKGRHAALYGELVYESGRVYKALESPDTDPGRTGFIDAGKITAPLLTIGAGKDRTTPVVGVRATADKYAAIGGDYREYPKNGHWIVDEPGTDRVIADIDAWLTDKLG